MTVGAEADSVRYNIQELAVFLGICLLSLVTLREVEFKHFSYCKRVKHFLCLRVHNESVVEPCVSNFTSNDSLAGENVIPSDGRMIGCICWTDNSKPSKVLTAYGSSSFPRSTSRGFSAFGQLHPIRTPTSTSVLIGGILHLISPNVAIFQLSRGRVSGSFMKV